MLNGRFLYNVKMSTGILFMRCVAVFGIAKYEFDLDLLSQSTRGAGPDLFLCVYDLFIKFEVIKMHTKVVIRVATVL